MLDAMLNKALRAAAQLVPYHVHVHSDSIVAVQRWHADLARLRILCCVLQWNAHENIPAEFVECRFGVLDLSRELLYALVGGL